MATASVARQDGMRILIVNLTRIGDQLQTSPTIAGLKARYPEAEITLLGDVHHIGVCHHIPGIDHVYAVDLDRIGHALLAGGTGLVDAYRYVEGVVRELRARGFNLAFNFSSSRMTSVLMRLLRIPDCRGWTMDSEGHRLIAHPWSRLFVASVLNRRYAPYNLVDVYCRVAGVRPPAPRLWYEPGAEGRAQAGALLATLGIGAEERLVALQPGASGAIRQWPPEAFVQLGQALHERLGARIVVLGSAAESERSAHIVRAIGPAAIGTAGRTDLPTLAGVLERAALLVTGDTGPMHLAVAVGTPVVAFFFGPAYVWETGPYAADSLAFQTRIACSPCHHAVRCLAPVCREELEPEMVFAAVRDRLAGDFRGLAQRARLWKAVDVFRIGFDAEGMYDLQPLVPRPDAADALRLVYREMWRVTLDGGDAVAAAARVALRWRARAGRPIGVELTAPRRALSTLRQLGERGRVLATRLVAEVAGRAPAFDRIQALGTEIEGVDRAIERQGFVEDAVGTLARTFGFGKENLSETRDVSRLGTETIALYDDLVVWATTSLDLLDVIDHGTGDDARRATTGATELSAGAP
jgi:ADP-heptose:LPS heptosyltransferase